MRPAEAHVPGSRTTESFAGLETSRLVSATEIILKQLEPGGKLWILLGSFQRLPERNNQNGDQQPKECHAHDNRSTERPGLPLWYDRLVQLLHDQRISRFVYFCCLILLD